jgi:hypothetical protein
MKRLIAVALVACGAVLASLAFGATSIPVSQCDYHSAQGCPKVPPSNSCHLAGELQDRRCTPGALNPAVKQSTIRKTICKTGWTTTIRPPTSYTDPLKVKDMSAYGDGGKSVSNFEFDHLISLELGGAPSDIRNLWPESHSNSYTKDGLENSLNHQVCAGTITLRKAQREIDHWPAHIHS